MKRSKADKQYRQWLIAGNKKLVVDPEPLRPYLRLWVKEHDGVVKLSEAVLGPSGNPRNLERRIRGILAEGKDAEFDTLDRICVAMGRPELLSLLLPPPGEAGWSEESHCCLRCGTYFHPHCQDGLCERCYTAGPDGESLEDEILRRISERGEYVEEFRDCASCGEPIDLSFFESYNWCRIVFCSRSCRDRARRRVVGDGEAAQEALEERA